MTLPDIPWNERPLGGCLFETGSVQAGLVTATSSEDLPSLIDLRPLCSVVEDQRKTNSCTANAVVGALEYHQRKMGLEVTDLSRMFVYYNARQLAGSEDRDVGSFIHHAMAAVLAHGACEERMWPFQEAMCKVRPTEAAYANAQHYQAVQYGRAPLGRITMASLAAGVPVVFGTYIPGSFYDVAGQTGRMPGPGEQHSAPAMGHAMLLVGYDQSEQVWIVRNSWGARWADAGYMRVPFATLKAYSNPTHFWTIGAIEQSTELSLATPRMDSAGSLGADGAQALPTERPSTETRAEQGFGEQVKQSRKGFRDRLRGE